MSTMKVINFQHRSTVEKGYGRLLLQFYRLCKLRELVDKNGFGSNTNRMSKRNIRFVCSRIRAKSQGCVTIFEGCVTALVLCILTIVREATTVEKCDPAVLPMIPDASIHNIYKLWNEMRCWPMVSFPIADLIAGLWVKHIPREIVEDLIGRVIHVLTGAGVLIGMDKPWPLISKMYAFRSQGAYVNLMDNGHKRFGDAYKGNLKVLCPLRRGTSKCLEIWAIIDNQLIQFVVDTGSNHNVISESYAQFLGLVPVSAAAFEVDVATDETVEIKSICEGVHWEMEGVEGIHFVTDFYVLPVEKELAVLGMDWLGTLGMTKCNFAIPSMEFRKGGKVICLRGSTVEVYPARNWLLLSGKILIVIVVFIVFIVLCKLIL